MMTSLLSIVLIGFLWIMPVSAVQNSNVMSPSSQDVAQQDPQQLVQSITNRVLSKLQMQREEMRRDPGRIYALVEELVLPHFDFERMSRWVLGRHWSTATPDQHTRFIEEFRNLLVRTYGVALLDYTDEKLQFLPSRGNSAQGEALVRMNLQHHGTTIYIDSNLYLKDNAWKVFDVVINGVSLVANYRSSFAAEIRKNGLDGLITRLGERNQGTKE